MALSALDRLLAGTAEPNTIVTPSGVYIPSLNVWVCRELIDGSIRPATVGPDLLEGFAALAIAGGALHLQQLAAARQGKIWPQAWIDAAAADDLLAHARRVPATGSAYVCVTETGAIPYQTAFRAELDALGRSLDQLLAIRHGEQGDQIRLLTPFLSALRHALTDDKLYPGRHTTLDLADLRWLQVPEEARLLPLAGFTENYADPFKTRVQHIPAVIAWARAVNAQTGLPPWKTFFEFRLFDRVDGVVTQPEIGQIEQTIRRLYARGEDEGRGIETGTAFRRVLFCGGHGANPPKSAKNYPNQDWIRQEHGYRNTLFANQVEDRVRNGLVPMLQLCFQTPWAHRPGVEHAMLRAQTLFLIAHEQTHPWVQFGELSWLEEMKCDVLGLHALLENRTVPVELADLMAAVVGSRLNLFRRYHALTGQDAAQLRDYYVGDTLLLTYLMQGGFFELDAQGDVVDIRPERAPALIAGLAARILAIQAGTATPGDLHAEFYQDEQVFTHFPALRARA